MTLGMLIAGLWIAWFLSWIAASFWKKPAARTAGIGRELPYRITVIAGAFLIYWYRPLPWGLAAPLWQLEPAWAWLAVACLAIGFAFSWWARLHLGTLWSSNVTRKDGHRIVDSGPYAIVRHPIYTGILIALVATAAVKATPLSFLGLALMIAGFAIKARLEERFLREELGPADYDAYARRVPMLVPFAPGRR